MSATKPGATKSKDEPGATKSTDERLTALEAQADRIEAMLDALIARQSGS